jgi:hypothetical protein
VGSFGQLEDDLGLVFRVRGAYPFPGGLLAEQVGRWIALESGNKRSRFIKTDKSQNSEVVNIAVDK